MTASTIAIPRPGVRAATPPLPGSPAIYFGALVVIGLMLAPIAHHHRRLPHQRADHRRSVGLPSPWVTENYPERARQHDLLG